MLAKDTLIRVLLSLGLEDLIKVGAAVVRARTEAGDWISALFSFFFPFKKRNLIFGRSFE
jgi:hypothetical protein